MTGTYQIIAAYNGHKPVASPNYIPLEVFTRAAEIVSKTKGRCLVWDGVQTDQTLDELSQLTAVEVRGV